MSLVILLGIPHISDRIIQYLSNRDLPSCSLVCIQWHSLFNPVIWSEPSRSRKVQMEASTLFKYQHHIKSINNPYITRKIFESLDNGWTFSNLRELYFNINEVIRVQTAQKWFQWVQGIYSLRELDVEISSHDPIVQKSLVATLKSLPMLRSFSILIAMGYNNEFSLVSKQEVIKACSHLDSLKFIDITHTSPFSFQTDSETAIAVVKSMNDSQDMKIKKLDIRLSSKYEEACILIPLLNICRELRSLTLNSDFQPNTVANIARIFKSGSYINLDELHLRVIREVDQDDIRLPTILDAFNEAFVGKTYMIGLGHGLHSLSLGNKMEIHRPLIQCITKFQLTRLELLDTTRISIPLFSEVMHSLPNLISVQAAIHTKYHAQVGFHADEDIYKEWMCVGLAELKILIERSYVKRTISGKPIESPNTFLFDQIGRLEHLTDFDITTRYQDILSLKSGPGHLRQLSGLKQLRSIKITSSECHLGAEEAQWMIDNWPKLTFIEGKTCRLGEPFKSKLLKARAHLIAI